ncbi:retrovirus-related pol polyprotein from transposon TNT 1-94 [Tanacetum coccineum]
MGEVECRQIKPLPLGEPKGKETASRKTYGSIEVKGESANTCLLDLAVNKFKGDNTSIVIQPPCYSASKDFQDSPDDEEDTRSSHEYLNDLEEEYQARGLLAKSKRFFKNGTQRFISSKATDQTECHKCAKKGHFARDCLIVETYDWDNEEVSSDENEVTKVKALMALTNENRVLVGKESAINGDWTKISMKKVHTLL